MRRIIIIQPALPSYRIDFFHRLAEHFGVTFCVYYSKENLGALSNSFETPNWSEEIGSLYQPLPGIEWQVGALSIPIKKTDLVIVCGAPRNLTTFLLLIKTRLKGAHGIWWGHYWSATSKPWRHHLRMQLTKLADGLLFYTQSEVDLFSADGYHHRGPINGLNNGINLEPVREHRNTYNADKRGQNILFIGRLTRKARLDLMLEAMTEKNLSNIHLHVIGEGTLEGELKIQADALGVTSRITWHGGFTDEALIADVANQCAAFVYPGQVGLSLIHAMGYGLPCIVHDHPRHHMPEIAAFSDGKTGISFKEGSASSLAIAVFTLLTRPTDREQMAAQCLEITRMDYNTKTMANRFISFLDEFDNILSEAN